LGQCVRDAGGEVELSRGSTASRSTGKTFSSMRKDGPAPHSPICRADAGELEWSPQCRRARRRACGALCDARCARAVSASVFRRPALHAHDTVGTNSPDYNTRYGRDIAGLDVHAYTANDFQITDGNWNLGVKTMHELHKNGEFVCYPCRNGAAARPRAAITTSCFS
jgi:hypothetical protein